MKRSISFRGPRMSLTAFMVALGVACLMILLADKPGHTILWLLSGAFRSYSAFGSMLENAARLTITGLAAAIVFNTGLFNLGGEGQAVSGGLSAAAMAIMLPDLPIFPAMVISITVGMGAGGIMGGFSGFLKARYECDELISSFLLSLAILPVGGSLLGGAMRDPESYLIGAPPLPSTYRLPQWLPPSNLSPIVLWAVILVVLSVLFLYYTRYGYEWRLRGVSPRFASYGGINTNRITVLSMTLSGSLYGLGGVTALLNSGQAIQGFTSGLGWNGLVVALIAGNRLEFVPLAALAYAWLITGTQSAMTQTGFPFAFSGLIQAVVFLLITVGRKRIE